MWIVGILAIVLANIALICGYMSHWKKIMQDIIEDEKEKVWADADAEIERRANKRVREILRGIRYTKKVELVNESNIKWGE